MTGHSGVIGMFRMIQFSRLSHACERLSTCKIVPNIIPADICCHAHYYYAVAIGPVTGPLVPWLLVRQLVTWSSTNQIHAIFMRSTMRFVPYLHSSRIAGSSVQSDIFSPVGSILAA